MKDWPRYVPPHKPDLAKVAASLAMLPEPLAGAPCEDPSTQQHSAEGLQPPAETLRLLNDLAECLARAQGLVRQLAHLPAKAARPRPQEPMQEP